jgi:hypothetical protein
MTSCDITARGYNGYYTYEQKWDGCYFIHIRYRNLGLEADCDVQHIIYVIIKFKLKIAICSD